MMCLESDRPRPRNYRYLFCDRYSSSPWSPPVATKIIQCRTTSLLRQKKSTTTRVLVSFSCTRGLE